MYFVRLELLRCEVAGPEAWDRRGATAATDRGAEASCTTQSSVAWRPMQQHGQAARHSSGHHHRTARLRSPDTGLHAGDWHLTSIVSAVDPRPRSHAMVGISWARADEVQCQNSWGRGRRSDPYPKVTRQSFDSARFLVPRISACWMPAENNRVDRCPPPEIDSERYNVVPRTWDWA